MDFDWNIAVWPTIQKTESGNFRREQEKIRKQLSTARNKKTPAAVAIRQSVSEGAIPTESANTRVTRSSQRGAKPKTTTRTSAKSTATTPAPGSSASGIASTSSFPQSAFTFTMPQPSGTEQCLFHVSFAEIGPLANVLDNPRRNFTSVSDSRARLRSIFYQEEAALKALTGLIEERKEIIEELFSKLTAERWEIAAREGIKLPPNDDVL